ncbi:9683_t:CDS:2, partial [Racocetra persica]
VHHIINVASYSDLKSYVDNEIFKNKYELSKLISDKVITRYYPLHDKSKKSLDISFYDKSKENLDEPFHDKSKENFDKPLHDKSKENLNKDLTANTRIFWRKLALYFAFMSGFYTNWLIIPFIVGVIMFIYGLIDAFSRGAVSSKDIDGIPSIVDNALTVPFALFISLWCMEFTIWGHVVILLYIHSF